MKIELSMNKSDIESVIDAVRFQEHIRFYDKPLLIQRAFFAEGQIDKKKYLQLQVLGNFFIPFDLDNLEQMISDLKKRDAEKK